jgi:hypothetical protein
MNARNQSAFGLSVTHRGYRDAMTEQVLRWGFARMGFRLGALGFR